MSVKGLLKYNYSSFPLIQKKITHWPNTNMVVLSQKDPFCYIKMIAEENFKTFLKKSR